MLRNLRSVNRVRSRTIQRTVVSNRCNMITPVWGKPSCVLRSGRKVAIAINAAIIDSAPARKKRKFSIPKKCSEILSYSSAAAPTRSTSMAI